MKVKQISGEINSDKYLTVLFIFSIVLIILNYYWIKEDTSPPLWDQAWYLETSEHLYHSLTEQGIAGLLKSFSHALGGIKAPLISVLPIPFYLILGNSEMSAMAVNFSFLFLMSIFLFRLVELMSNKETAFLSVLVTQTMPLFYAMNRQFFVEYGLATLVVIFFYFLLRSNFFENRKDNIILGLLAGLGLLMKITFIFYVFFPFLWVLYLRYKYKKDTFTIKFFGDIFITGLITVLICSIWYFPNIKTLAAFAFSTSFGTISVNYGPQDVYSLKTISAYLMDMVQNGLSFYYFIFILICTVISHIIFREKTKLLNPDITVFLFLWFLFPLSVCTFARNKCIRYILPVLPVISIFTGIIVNRITSKMKSGLLYMFICGLIILFPFVAMIRSSFFLTKYNDGSYIYTPDKRDWKTAEIIEYIYRELYKQENPRPYTIIAIEHAGINANSYSYIASRKNYNYPLYFTGLEQGVKEPDKMLKRIDSLRPSFIICEEGIKESELPDFLNGGNNILRIKLEQREIPYEKDRIFELDKGVRLILFKRIIEHNVSERLDEKYEIPVKQYGKEEQIFEGIYFAGYKYEETGHESYKFSFIFKVTEHVDKNFRIYFHGYVKNKDLPLLPEERRKYKFDNWDFSPEPSTSFWQAEKFIVITREITAKPVSYDFYIGFFDEHTGVRYGKEINIKWEPAVKNDCDVENGKSKCYHSLL